MKRFYVSPLLAAVAGSLTWTAAVAGPSASPATVKADCACEDCKCPNCDAQTCTCDKCECTDCGCAK